MNTPTQELTRKEKLKTAHDKWMSNPENRAKRAAYQKEWVAKNQEKKREYMKEYMKKYSAEDPEHFREMQRKSHEKNRESRNAAARASYHSGQRRTNYLAKRYGVASTWYDETLAAQNGGCAICGRTDPGGRGERFHIDHCHTSGKVRGLLCNSCNHALGNARDESRILRAAADYLDRYLHLKTTSG